MVDITTPSNPVTKHWEGIPNLFGNNLPFWYSFTEGSHGLINNLRYACRRAVGYGGSPAPTLDAQLWPTVAAGEQAVIYMFTGMFIEDIYLDPNEADTLTRLQKVYRPGKYTFEITTAEGYTNPLTAIAGNAGYVTTPTQAGGVGVPAIYEVTIPVDGRGSQGIEIILNGQAGGLTLTDLVIYHEDDADLDHDVYTWADDFVETCARNTHLRDGEMRFMNEEGARIGTLAELPTADWCTWGGIGPPDEAMIALCNAANCDYYQFIPAEAALNVPYMRSRAIAVRDNLKPELRVWPFVGNEVWNGDGGTEYDSFKSAYIFQSEHTVTLGLPQTFDGRMQAQSYAQRLCIDTYKNVFSSDDPDRVVPLLETQIGNTGATLTKLNHVYPDGKTLGDILNEFGGYVMVAPYFIALDTNPYYQFETKAAEGPTALKQYLDGIILTYSQGFTQSLNSAKATRDAVQAVYPNIEIGTYEGIFQDGIPTQSQVQDWEAGAPAQGFVGMAREYDAQFLPGERRIFFSKVQNPDWVTFDYAEWTETEGKVVEDYTAGELVGASKCFQATRGTAEMRAALVGMMSQWRAEFSAPFTNYKFFNLPASTGHRGIVAEREEPVSQLVYTVDGYEENGPWGTWQWFLDVSLRPNGELPGDTIPPTPGTPGLDLGVGGPIIVPPFPGRPDDDDGDGGDDGGDDGGGVDPGDDDPGNDGEDPGTGVLTSLTAVNELLASIHRAPITTLENPDRETQLAINSILRAEREIQQKGWHWNVEYSVPLEPEEDGRVKLPANTLSVDADGDKTTLNLTQRGDYLYDVDNHTAVLDTTVYVNLTYQLAYDDLPVYAKAAVIARATVLFEQRVQGDPYVGRLLEFRYREVMDVMEAHELANDQQNYLTSPPIRTTLNRRFWQ